MTVEIAILLLIIVALVVVMALELMPTDTLAITLMVVLVIGGFVSPKEGIAGLSNEATVTILALMILSIGLEVNGVVALLGSGLKDIIGRSEQFSLFILLLIVGTCSALISTTAVVIVFMRILIKLSKTLPMKLSKYLMPLSFAGIMGGSCTLLGTSTNLLVSSIAEEHDLAPFAVFEFTHIGVIFFVCGLLYMIFVGRYLIPVRKKEEEDLIDEYNIEEFLTEVIIPEGSSFDGKRVDETPFFRDKELDLIEVIKKGKDPYFPTIADRLEKEDILLVKADLDHLGEIRKSNDVKMLSIQTVKDEERLNTQEMTLCEVIVKPNSRLVGQSLDKINFKQEFEAIPLAIKKQKGTFRTRFERLKIEPGDVLLLEIGRANYQQFYDSPEMVVLQEHEALVRDTSKRTLSAAIMVLVILIAALNILPILVSALAGCVAMFLTGCLKLQNAYRKIDWDIIFLLAGIIPLGTAMENTGASQLIATGFTEYVGQLSPMILVGTLYLVVTLLTAVMSNNATAILFAPIVISIAANLGIDSRPLLLTVMFAANMSFISPIGYQTNTLVYGVGQYRFGDFFKVGGFLSLIIWILATLLIPYFYF
ncbi:MAG: SLC13 family permease [Saprospiraceae bacterium]|nr:SLC13 family permease [Saprospiraceae bacterium]